MSKTYYFYLRKEVEKDRCPYVALVGFQTGKNYYMSEPFFHFSGSVVSKKDNFSKVKARRIVDGRLEKYLNASSERILPPHVEIISGILLKETTIQTILEGYLGFSNLFTGKKVRLTGLEFARNDERFRNFLNKCVLHKKG